MSVTVCGFDAFVSSTDCSMMDWPFPHDYVHSPDNTTCPGDSRWRAPKDKGGITRISEGRGQTSDRSKSFNRRLSDTIPHPHSIISACAHSFSHRASPNPTGDTMGLEHGYWE